MFVVATLLAFKYYSHIFLLCLLLLRSGLSHNVLAATLLAFQHNFRLRSCCYALGFPTLHPTTFLLLGSGFSKIISDDVSAATLLALDHNFVLLCLLLRRSWPFNMTSHYILAGTLLACQHNFLFVVATLLTFKHYFLLRSCCYDLGFTTQFPTMFVVAALFAV